jgi:16S rRNA processing protein RimM
VSPDGSAAKWIAVGRIVRPRGNRGELITEIYSTQPGRAERLEEVRLEKDSRSRMAKVEEFWVHDGKPVFKFEGVDSISDAQVWVGADVLVPESERALPEEGEYSHADLIGCTVVGRADGRHIGMVEGIEDGGGPVLLRLAGEKEILIPFARKICVEIDVDRKEIRVDLPNGLLDL